MNAERVSLFSSGMSSSCMANSLPLSASLPSNESRNINICKRDFVQHQTFATSKIFTPAYRDVYSLLPAYKIGFHFFMKKIAYFNLAVFFPENYVINIKNNL